MAKRRIHTTFECFVEKDGKYLMLKRSPDRTIMPGIWMAPGGHVLFCRGLFAEVRRRIMEETHLSIKDIKIRAAGIVYIQDINSEFALHLLTAKYKSGDVKANPHDGELKWLKPEEILKLDMLLGELVDVLPHVFSDDPMVVSYRAVYESGNNMIEFEIENPD